MKTINRTGIIMMIFAVLLILADMVLAEGEWAKSGDNIYSTNNGNVGIGTTNPDNAQGWNKVLNLHGASHAKLLVTEGSGVKTGIFSHRGYNGKIGTESNHNLTFTAGYWNDVMTLTTAGKVGIGTTVPEAKLDVHGQIIGGFGAQTTAGTLDWNDTSNIRSGSGYTLLQGDHENGPGPNAYFHPFNFEYSSKNGTGNITQMAIPYGLTSHMNAGIYMRGSYSGSWSPWMRILSENSIGNVGIGTANPGQTLDIEGNLELNGSLVGGVSSARVYYNLLAARWGGAQTGALVIRTNVPQDDHTMTQTKVILKRKYSSGKTNCEYLISGYWSTEGNGGFQGRGYQAQCNDIQRIRFMRNSESGKAAIVIGETNTSWSHPMVAVPEFLAHYGIASDSYADGWTASIVNDLSGYVNSDDVTNNSPIHETGSRVGIGTMNPPSELAVNGTITAKEIKVTETGWSDFVFEDEYELPPLSSVESYIQEHKHLPDIPSAKEVKQQGITVSEILAKQMQKIEELTLYLIKLEKENEALKVKNAEFEKRLAKLEEDV